MELLAAVGGFIVPIILIILVILILAASRLTFGFQDTDYLKRCFIDTQSFANSIAFGEQIIDNRLSDNTNSGSAAEITFSHITAFS